MSVTSLVDESEKERIYTSGHVSVDHKPGSNFVITDAMCGIDRSKLLNG